MMKHLSILIIALIFSISSNAQTKGTLSVSLSTSSTGGNYAPRNVVAVWIEDDAGNFVKTLMAYAASRKTHLNTWQATTSAAGSEYNTIDAITGATQNSHKTYECTWDGTDINGNLVADGDYFIWMELTDKNATGNYSNFPFTKGSLNLELNPDDVPSFSDLNIIWEPNTGVDFAPIGAKWYYDQSTINPDLQSYKTFESIKDTTINTIICKKIIESERYLEVVKTTNHFMYKEHDSVYFYADNAFHLLYDFGAIKGDTIVLDYFDAYEGKLSFIVDSVGMIDINGQTRTIQYVTSGDGILVEFANEIIEGIGSSHFLFPTYDGTMNGKLRCYEDNELGLFKNPFYYGGTYPKSCDFTTSIESFKDIPLFEIFPNPTKDHLNIRCSSEIIYTLELRDAMGKIVLNEELTHSKNINLSNFPKGLYFVIIKSKDEIVKTKKIMRQ